jgi:hypothetical protein
VVARKGLIWVSPVFWGLLMLIAYYARRRTEVASAQTTRAALASEAIEICDATATYLGEQTLAI